MEEYSTETVSSESNKNIWFIDVGDMTPEEVISSLNDSQQSEEIFESEDDENYVSPDDTSQAIRNLLNSSIQVSLDLLLEEGFSHIEANAIISNTLFNYENTVATCLDDLNEIGIIDNKYLTHLKEIDLETAFSEPYTNKNDPASDFHILTSIMIDQYINTEDTSDLNEKTEFTKEFKDFISELQSFLVESDDLSENNISINKQQTIYID